MGQWPIYFLLFAMLLSLNHRKYRAYGASEHLQNVGTVLFDRNSLSNHCWTNEEIIILNSRRMFQELLPKMKALEIQTDEYIADLLSYFYVCLEHVSRFSTGKTRHLMLKSLADTMGGYLHSYVFSITKASFYAGKVKYCNIEKVQSLLIELKTFLRTNGAGWKDPIEIKTLTNVTPLVVKVQDPKTACSQLIDNFALPQRDFYRKKSHPVELETPALLNYYEDENFNRSQDPLYMFLPYLDSDVKPNSIAVPFKDRSLWSLYEERSVSILIRYYETSVNCISSMEDYQQVLTDFNKMFYNWLLRSVYSHLNDDKWYPAFEGVLRIIELLRVTSKADEKKRKFLTLKKVADSSTHWNGKLIAFISLKFLNLNGTSALGTAELIMIAISSAIVIWILVGLCLICYRYIRKHPEECSPCDSPNSDVAMLYKNDDFGQLKVCRSETPGRSMSEKVQEWWRRTFKRCPGGCDLSERNERCLSSYIYSSKGSMCSSTSKKSFK